MKKTVLVTGGNGQLASCVKAISRQYPTLHFLFVDRNSLDITDAVNVSDYFNNNKIDWCVNCAAYTAVDRAEEEPDAARKVNVSGAKNLARACQEHDATLIHISTDFVFDGSKTTPYTELDVPNPINTYGRTKLEGEQALKQVLEKYFILRTSWLYSEFGNNFLKTMLRLGKDKKELHVVNDQYGTPTYAGDLAQFICHLIQTDSKSYGIYHYSNEGALSWFDFAQGIFEEADLVINLKPIPTSAYPTLAKRPLYSVLDKSKIKQKFNNDPIYWKYSLEICIGNLNEALN